MGDRNAPELITDLGNSSTLAAFGIAAVLVIMGAFAHRYAPQRFGWWRISAAAMFLVVVAVTQLPTRPIGSLGQVELAGSIKNALTWPLDGIDRTATFTSAGWWLNILLFVPLGFCVRGMLRERATWSAAAVVAAASFVVESAQAFTGWRSADLADFTANSVGGVIGCALLVPVSSAVEPLRRRAEGVHRAWRLAATGTTAVLLAGLFALVVLASADSAQRSLLHELRTRYRTTNLETMDEVFFSAGDDEAFDKFLSASSVRPDSVVHTTNPAAVQVRYPVEQFGLHRCVFVTWHPDGVSFRADDGDRCTEFLGS